MDDQLHLGVIKGWRLEVSLIGAVWLEVCFYWNAIERIYKKIIFHPGGPASVQSLITVFISDRHESSFCFIIVIR